jgi:hypothetical protein
MQLIRYKWLTFATLILCSTSATAQIIYDFEGQCSIGCSGSAQGVLTLAETLDGVPTTLDFVSFEFTSSQGSYSIPGDSFVLVVNEFVGDPLPATSGTAETFLDWVGTRSYFVTDTEVFNNFTSSFTDADWAARLVDGAVIEGGTGYTWTRRVEAPSAEDQLLDLIEAIVELNAGSGLGNSFDRKLQNALDALDRAEDGNSRAATGNMRAFINSVEAQRGKQLLDSDADALIEAAEDIIETIGT